MYIKRQKDVYKISVADFIVLAHSTTFLTYIFNSYMW